MKTSMVLAISIVLLGFALSGCSNNPNVSAQANLNTRPKKTMRAFKSDQELKQYLKKHQKRPNVTTNFGLVTSNAGGPTEVNKYQPLTIGSCRRLKGISSRIDLWATIFCTESASLANAPEEKLDTAVYALRWSGGEPVKLALAHAVDRIEPMGTAAVVVGAKDGDLHFSAASLGNLPRVEHDYIRIGASQGELRSHGFFYKPDGPDSGVLGLPIAEAVRGRYDHLNTGSASVLYLRNYSLRFKELGNLAANPKNATDDQCRASCVDWYGNSRPLFLGGRVFALLGYELVEGVVSDGRIREMRRSNHAPQLSDSARN